MILLLLAFLLIATPAFSADNPLGETVPASVKWGYIDKSGAVVIKAKYSHGDAFSEGAALVRNGADCTFIDKSGKKLFAVNTGGVVPEPGPFHEGLSAYRTSTGTGYVDKTGQFVIEPKFLMAGSFSEGLAAALGDENKWGYIDSTGKFVIPPRFSSCLEFSEGLAAARDGDRWGFIDHSGDFRIKPQYAYALSFAEGLAPVYSKDNSYSYIDLNGKIALEGPYHCASTFTDGIAVVDLSNSISKGSSMRRYIDRTGKILDLHTSPGPGAEGMLPFTENGRVGFANVKDEEVISPKYEATSGFSDDLASVKVHGKWGYIDKSGKMVVAPTFDAAYPFSCGRAAVAIKHLH